MLGFFTTSLTLPAWALVAVGLCLVSAVAACAVLVCRGRSSRSRATSLADDLRRSESDQGELRQSEAKYRHLYQQAPVGIFRTATDGSRVLVGNGAAARMFGYQSVEDFLDQCRPADVYVDPGQREELIRRLNEQGRVEDFEILVRRPDGSRKYLSLTGHLQRDEGYLEGALLDVTARRRAERELQDSHLFLQTVMETIPNPLLYRDASGVFRHVNAAFEQFTGFTRKDVLGHRADLFMAEDAAREWTDRAQELMDGSGGAMHRFDTRLRTREGRRDVVIHEGSVADSSGRRIGLVGVVTDVSEFKRVEAELRAAWVTYRNIFENAVDGIFTSTVEGRFIRANKALADMLGYDSIEDLTESVTDIATQVYADPAEREAMLEELAEDDVVSRHEMEVRRKDGSTTWIAVSLRAIKGEDGEVERIEGVAADVAERKRREIELARRALTDPLTGLPNRAAFEREFERMIAQAGRSGRQVGVLFMDLDGFKPVNDTYGHQVGDELLQAMADRLRARVRGSDVPARLGGDEFGVLLWEVGSEESMQYVAEEIIESLNQPVALDACECEVGVSVGGSLYPDHGETPRDLIRRADQAMYAVKQGGRNAYKLAEDEDCPSDAPNCGTGDDGATDRSDGEDHPADVVPPDLADEVMDSHEDGEEAAVAQERPGPEDGADAREDSEAPREAEAAPAADGVQNRTQGSPDAEDGEAPGDGDRSTRGGSGEVPRGDDSLSLLKPLE